MPVLDGRGADIVLPQPSGIMVTMKDGTLARVQARGRSISGAATQAYGSIPKPITEPSSFDDLANHLTATSPNPIRIFGDLHD